MYRLFFAAVKAILCLQLVISQSESLIVPDPPLAAGGRCSGTLCCADLLTLKVKVDAVVKLLPNFGGLLGGSLAKAVASLSAEINLLQCKSRAVCKPGFTERGGICYIVVSDKKDYFDAQKHCLSLHKDAHLAHARNQKQNDNVVSVMLDFIKTDSATCREQQGNSFFVGLRRRDLSKTCDVDFRWMTNNPETQIPLDWTNWAAGEPNCADNAENCVTYFRVEDANARWNDDSCLRTLCSICQYKL